MPIEKNENQDGSSPNEVTYLEIEIALKKMRCGKAPGIDEVSTEII